MADSRRTGPAAAGGATQIAPPGASAPSLHGMTPVPGGVTPVPGYGTGVPAPVTAMPSMPPSLVGTVLADRYRVIKKLGEGGMGTVYLAEHTTINKKLAIKVLSSEYSHKQDLVDRFLQEARAASMIEQENVVEITDFGSTPNGSVFFVMEFLNGEDLSKTVKKGGPLPWSRVKPIMLQICAALTAAHDAGIIHRDMKPENCYRIKRGGGEDFIKVLDFGIAKVTSEDGETGGKGLTRTGMIFGTPEYMSPEQAKGEKVDHRVDVYAVGVILYELLTGRVPFTADTFMGILTKHMFEAPPAPSTVVPGLEIPPQVEAIILKALQKDREYRFQSMRELAAAIEAVGTDSAAVAVVAENLARPSGGQTHFRDSTTGVPLHEHRGGDAGHRTKSGTGVLIGVAAFVLALGGAGVVLMVRDDDGPTPSAAGATVTDAGAKTDQSEQQGGGSKKAKDSKDGGKKAKGSKDGGKKAKDPKDDADADDAGATSAAEGGTSPESGGQTPLEPTEVAITVSTPKVSGDVIDGLTQAVLGKTNEPLQLSRGTDDVELVERGDGDEDATVPVVPDGDKTVKASLTKIRKTKRGGRNGSRTGGDTKSGGES